MEAAVTNRLSTDNVAELQRLSTGSGVTPPRVEQTTFLVNGELREWQGAREPVFSPLFTADQNPPCLGSYPALTSKEALEIVDAATTAYDRGLGEWPQTSAFERVQAVMRFASAMLEVRETVVDRLVWEIGKTQADAEKEFDRTIQYIRESCDALLAMDSAARRPVEFEGVSATVGKTPLGVTLCMGPFNYPLNETFTTLIPALLMGNTTILKPARFGVLLLEPLQKGFQECFPAGVVNIVYGDGKEVIGPIMESGKVDVLAFIGSGKVADIVTAQHPAQHRLTRILGLGAKNPAIILGDADLEGTVKKAVNGSLSYNGQRCTALKIHFVDERIAEEYADRFGKAVERLAQGMPWEPGVSITPLAEGADKIKYLQELVRDAVQKGARIVNAGGGTADGNLFTPAVLFPVTPEMRIYKEEQFGPIVPIVPVASSDEAVRYIADSEFGQQVSIFGKNDSQIDHMAVRLAPLVGRVNINDECKRGPDALPFSGRKSSALGTLSIVDALNVFSLPSVIARGT